MVKHSFFSFFFIWWMPVGLFYQLYTVISWPFPNCVLKTTLWSFIIVTKYQLLIVIRFYGMLLENLGLYYLLYCSWHKVPCCTTGFFSNSNLKQPLFPQKPKNKSVFYGANDPILQLMKPAYIFATFICIQCITIVLKWIIKLLLQ